MQHFVRTMELDVSIAFMCANAHGLRSINMTELLCCHARFPPKMWGSTKSFIITAHTATTSFLGP